MTQTPTANAHRPRALADLHFNDHHNSDAGTSSEDESLPYASANDVHSLVGVSIGPKQTHLTSPQTPALEKVAALEEAGGFSGQDVEVPQDQEQEEVYRNNPLPSSQARKDTDNPTVQNLYGARGRSPQPSGGADTETKVTSPEHRLPSPWRARVREFQDGDRPSRGLLREGFLKSRRRASSDPKNASLAEQWQTSFLSSFSGLPKYFSMSTPFADRRSTTIVSKGATIDSQTAMNSAVDSLDGSGPSKTSRMRTRSELPSLGQGSSDFSNSSTITNSPKSQGGSLPSLNTRESYLRRSASDHSLQLQSALSRVSSLGDDSRFENIQGQVNSRLKAIKDTWQDSSIRLPSLPAIPNFSFESFKPDLYFSSRSNQANPQQRNSLLVAPQSQRRLPLRENSNDVENPVPSREELKQSISSTDRVTAGGPTEKSALTHPHFTKACVEQEGDLVILGGYRGSILRSAEPPHHQLWVPIKVGLNLRKVDLEVGFEPEDDENSESKVIPGGMLTHIGPVDITRRLFRRLRATENARTGRLRVHDYGYDWRLDPLVLSRKLIEYLEALPCNQPGVPKNKRGATVIAHSLGGLITRHAINTRPELFAGVVFAGVPSRCVNILGPLRNGDDVLLSSRVLTAQVNFSVRTSFALLPLDGRCFFNKETREEFPVDFFDPQTWIDYRLSPCMARPLPPLNPPPPSMFSTLTSALPSIPGKRASLSFLEYARNAVTHPKEKTIGSIGKPGEPESSQSIARGNIDDAASASSNNNPSTSSISTPNNEPHVTTELDPSTMNHSPPSTSVATAVTISPEKALAYLTRTLARVKAFKQALDYIPSIGDTNSYPPAAIIYGKSTPTVYGAKVKDRDAIKRAGAYDDLAFASGDGVVLARASMLPDGYDVVKGGLISTDRGHITLLGDLEAVGRALNAVRRGREMGVGSGVVSRKARRREGETGREA